MTVNTQNLKEKEQLPSSVQFNISAEAAMSRIWVSPVISLTCKRNFTHLSLLSV